MSTEEKMLKTLSSKTRIDIIKELSNGYRTPSDLSRMLKKSKSTIVEHLEKLVNSGLVEKQERPGRKWVFYSLTREGEELVSSKTNKIIIILSVVFLSLIAGGFSLFNYLRRPLLMTEPLAQKVGGEATAIEGVRDVATTIIIQGNLLFLYASIILFSISIIGIVSIILIKRKRIVEV